MATPRLLLTVATVIACILFHGSWAQQLGRVPPAQISVNNPGEHGLKISVSNPGERGLIPSQPFFPESQPPPSSNLGPSAHQQQHSNAHLEEVQGEGIAVKDHAYRASAPGTVKPLAPVVLQALRAIQSKWSSTQIKPHSLKEEDHLNEISNRSQRTHRRAQRLVHPLQRPLTEFHGPVVSATPIPRPFSPNMDVKLGSIVPEQHTIDTFKSSPTKRPINHLLHERHIFEARRPQRLNTVTSPSLIKSIPSRVQHSDLELILHSGSPAIKTQVRHPLLDPQFQTRPVAPPTTGFLHTDSQRQRELGIPLPNFHQSNNHHTKNQTHKLTTKESSKLTEPFLAVFEQFNPNSKGEVFPDYDDEEYYYYDEYDDTYYDDYDYGLSGDPVTPLPFHATTTNHVEPTVTTTLPPVTTRTRSRGRITPPPSLFPVRPGQTASPTVFPSPSTKQPSKSPISFGINNEKITKPVHFVTSALRIIEAPVTQRHQVSKALQTPPHIVIQQPHPLHEFFIGDTSGIELKQSPRFPTTTDIPISSSCPECSTNPDKVIFPASPRGLRVPLSQDPQGVFNPDGSQTLVLSSHFLHHLHHSHTTTVPDQQPIYFTPHHSIGHNPDSGKSGSQTPLSPLRRLRRRKRRRHPSDYNVEAPKKQRQNRVPQHGERTDNSSSGNEIISDLTKQNNFQEIHIPVRESSIQNLKNETQFINQQLDVTNPRNKLAQTVAFSRRNPTRKPRRIINKINSSLLATFNAENSTIISPVSATFSRLPLPGLTASKQKKFHANLNVGGITVQPKSVPHHTQKSLSNKDVSTSGNNIGHAPISPFSGIPSLDSASPEEISRAAFEAVQGWRQDLRYPVVDLPLPSAALSGLPFVIDGHSHLGTFVVVPVT